MSNRTLIRSEVPVEQTWDLTDLFATEEAWEQELKAVENDLHMVTQLKGKIHQGAKVLLECLVARDALTERVSRVMTYAYLKQSGDGTDPANQTNSAKAASMMANYSASMTFIESEILALTDEELTAYIQEEVGLKEFHKTLSDLQETKPHRLSADAEEVLASFGEILGSPYMIYQRSKTSDMTFTSFTTSDGEEHPLTFNSFPTYEESADTELRRNAYAAFTKTLQQYKNTYAATYATEVKKQVIEARLRKFDSVTDMLLFEQQVTKEMYHNQLDTILTELAPHMRRLAKLKQRELGLEKMYFCDLKAPLDPGFEPSVTYEAPSTMNEGLLSQHILAQTNDERMRRWVILQSLGTYYHNFVTHILEGELQRRIYELADKGVPITATILCEQKVALLTDFWGDAVEIDEGAGLTWMRQPHYYMGLYPYTYSAGLTASTAAALTIQEEGQPAVDRWLAALKAGGTLKPLELMKLAGVDMSTPDPIKKAVAYVGALVDELEKSFN